MACREFSLWYNSNATSRWVSVAMACRDAMACREFSLWYNGNNQAEDSVGAMACREFSLWYN